MSLDSIKTRHEELKATKSTQSVKIVNELKSQAHKDRGELIELCEDLGAELQEQMKTVEQLRAALAEASIRGTGDLVRRLRDEYANSNFSYELKLTNARALLKEAADALECSVEENEEVCTSSVQCPRCKAYGVTSCTHPKCPLFAVEGEAIEEATSSA